MSEKKKISSGAKKAESLTRTEDNTASVEELKSNSAKKSRTVQSRKKPQNDSKTAKAQLKHERKIKEKELKNERKKTRAEERKQKRAALIEARAAKREAAAAERAARREHRLKVEAEKRANKKTKNRAPGFGGWLAAVISLGATCLVLATILTYGWITMSGMQVNEAGMQTRALYELNSIFDNLDTNLAKARVASSDTDRAEVLTDIAVQSEMAEMVLERLPLDYALTSDMAGFVNKMSDSARSMLRTTVAGGELEEWQISSLEYMYANNLKLKNALNEIVSKYDGMEMMKAMRGKENVLEQSFGDITNNAIEEPKGIFDGPFAEGLNDTNTSFFEGMEEISGGEAEEIAMEIFADYNVTGTRCTGSAEKGALAFYNVEISTDDGDMFAQISKKGGKLVMFDSYKECTQNNFSADMCTEIAAEFLKSVGFEGLEPVWVSEGGTTCNVNFCAVQDGVVLYPDMVKVKVCEERGIVTGAEAMGYVNNHSSRDMGGATITKAQAQSAINGEIEVNSSRLALIPLNGEEVLCYEFGGTYDGRDYFVYVDVATGDEVQVLTVIGTAQGRAIL